MPTANHNIKFTPCTKSQYDNLSTKDDDTIYFITDEYQMYVGSHEYTNTGNMKLPPDVPFDSEEDHPDYQSTAFGAILPGQVFRSSTMDVPDRYWIKIRTYNYFTSVEITNYATENEISLLDSTKMNLMPMASTEAQISALPNGQVYKSASGYRIKDTAAPNEFVNIITSHQDISGKMNLIPIVGSSAGESSLSDISIGQIFRMSSGGYTSYYIKRSAGTSSNSYVRIFTGEPDIVSGTSDKPSTETGSDVLAHSIMDIYINNTNGKLWMCTNISLGSGSPAPYIYTWSYKGTILDMSGKMDIGVSVPFDGENDFPDLETSQFNALLPGQIFASSEYVNNPRYWVKYRTQAGSFSYSAKELTIDAYPRSVSDATFMTLAPQVGTMHLAEDLNNGQLFTCNNGEMQAYLKLGANSYLRLLSSNDLEYGTVPTTYALHTPASETCTMSGNYTIIGNMCFLRATADLYEGWVRIYYPLPVAVAADVSSTGATIAIQNDTFFSIATGVTVVDGQNRNVLEIRAINASTMPSGTIHFTISYKCQ